MMDQKCLNCGKGFRIVELLSEVEGLKNYPVEAKAEYCPFCGDTLVTLPDKAKAAKA